MPDASGMSRRRFLQKAGAAGAGLTLGAHLPVQAGTMPIAAGSQFVLKFENGAIVSLRREQDQFDTDYIRPTRRLGDTMLTYRRTGGDWQTIDTSALGTPRTAVRSADGRQYTVTYPIQSDQKPALTLKSTFDVHDGAVLWTTTLHNLTGEALEIGDLALPLPMNTEFQEGKPVTSSVLKHSFVSGHGSYLFWMRSNSVGPYLTLTPQAGTSLEYWDMSGGYRVFIHSAAAGADAAKEGCRWRQPHTSLTLAPRGQSADTQTYGVKFQWAEGYDHVRQILVDEGLIDINVVPGMTVPSDLSARFALWTNQKIRSVEAEFPASTQIKALGRKGGRTLYEVRFSRLGENRLVVSYGTGSHVFLEFFATEPLETLIKKRAAFTAQHQHRDPAKWYNGLLAEWNMKTQTLLGPDNYDKITGWRIYEVTCDDPGLSRPAYLAAKSAEFPVQAEVEALDYYIQHFVWGGLQRTTEETYSYGIYGIPDWKTNRDSPDAGDKGKLHLWRVYDYPHIIVMYFGMYRVAKEHPQIATALTADEYLTRAYGTALALFTIPYEIVKWSAYETGLYNEIVIVDLIGELNAAGRHEEAAALRGHWERKVKFFVNDSPNLFGSEYPFDSTGFESTHALAKYAMQHADRPGETRSGIPSANAAKFMQTQIKANIFCRGALEPAYYTLGSDYRGSAGNAYTLSYMSQMGGWAVLDYGLNFAADPAPYLRLGYASYLSAWALVNSGTPESEYGYWYPGPANDGGAGGGFEPAPTGTTWLGQPHHRGSWYYSCEENLGYCGALRTAATVLTDDPIFGRCCFGGDWRPTAAGVEVIPKDGLRKRFHALLGGGRFHLVSDTARFAAGHPLVIQESLAQIGFSLESDNTQPHTAAVHLSGLPPGSYRISSIGARRKSDLAEIKAAEGQTVLLHLPMTGSGIQAFLLKRQTRKREQI
jgi:hypothetical protein